LEKDERKTGAFLTKIRALDGRKDGQIEVFIARKYDLRHFNDKNA
jgi:hypothetical protein